MRGMAQRLDVAPNALYSHGASRIALLDDVLADVQAPAEDIDDPTVGLHQLMTSAYHVLLTHPGLVPRYLARQGARGLNTQRLGDTTTTARPLIEVSDDRPLTNDQLLDNFTNGLRWLLEGTLHTAATRTVDATGSQLPTTSVGRDREPIAHPAVARIPDGREGVDERLTQTTPAD